LDKPGENKERNSTVEKRHNFPGVTKHSKGFCFSFILLYCLLFC